MQITDPNNNVTVFVYDPLGHVTSATDPLNHTSTRSYDLAGRLQEETNRNGLRSTFQYDGPGHLLTETWYAADGVTIENTLSYTYDLAGRLLTASDNAGTYTFTYDGAGRVQTVQDVWGLTLTFSYDAEGNRTGVQDSLGGTQTSTFDAAHRLLSRIVSASGLPTLELDQSYDQAGRLTSQSRYHDATQGPSLVTGSSYSYDAAGHITDLEHTNASNGTIAAYQYTYDAASQLTSATENGTTKTYGYDGAGQLTTVTENGTTTSYSFDGAGNRTMSGYTTGNGNQLTSDGTWNYSYDAEGNETKKVNISTGETWTYGYDRRNQLTWVEERVTDGGTLEMRAEYDYDVFGNRLEKQVDQDGDDTVDLTQRYAYDGFNPAKGGAIGNEHWDVWAELDGNSSLTTHYLHGDGIDQLFARTDADGSSFWLLTDHLNSVREVLDNTGAVKDSIRYDGYGNIVSESHPLYGGHYKYTNREYDVETKLQYNRARYYDATTGRWTTQDPLGFDAGDSNLYRYVHNQPSMATDPSGLEDDVYITFNRPLKQSTSPAEALRKMEQNIVILSPDALKDMRKEIPETPAEMSRKWDDKNFGYEPLQMFHDEHQLATPNKVVTSTVMVPTEERWKWEEKAYYPVYRFRDGLQKKYDDDYALVQKTLDPALMSGPETTLARPRPNLPYLASGWDYVPVVRSMRKAEYHFDNGEPGIGVLYVISAADEAALITAAAKGTVKMLGKAVIQGVGHAPRRSAYGALDLVTGENLPDEFAHNFAKYIQRRADIDPGGVYDVVVHGSHDFVLIGGSKADASYLAMVIRSQSDYTEGQSVRLLSCLLGCNEDRSFAQALANELGAEVQAANGLIRVTDTGAWDVVGYQIRRGRLMYQENVAREMIWFQPQ